MAGAEPLEVVFIYLLVAQHHQIYISSRGPPDRHRINLSRTLSCTDLVQPYGTARHRRAPGSVRGAAGPAGGREAVRGVIESVGLGGHVAELYEL